MRIPSGLCGHYLTRRAGPTVTRPSENDGRTVYETPVRCSICKTTLIQRVNRRLLGGLIQIGED